MTNTSQFWKVEARVKLLVASWNAGHNAREIAANLSLASGLPVTRNMVVSKVHRLGLRMHQAPNAWRGSKSGRPA